MRDKLAKLFAVATIGLAGEGACAMNGTKSADGRCQVTGAEKLPADLDGSQGLCSAIDRAVRASAPEVGFKVEVKVLSASMLAATVRLDNGTVLPEQKMAVNDRPLNRGSIERFAAAVAAEVAKASRQ